MTTKEMSERLDQTAGDLVELSMMRPVDNCYAGIKNHPAYDKINQAAALLADAVHDLLETVSEAQT